ncbi:MAG: hypothetical protein IKB96_09160 [Prevotella sp.]|nr:hypothetical protein [Prevotella sp.]
MPAIKIPKIVSQGLQDIITTKLNSGFTGYESEAVKWTGETAIVFTPTRTTTELPSGNDPAWMVKQGLVVGDVELTLYDIAINHMEKLFGVKYSAADGVVVGDTDDAVPFIGLSFDRLVTSESGESRNKFILYKVRFDLPVIDTKTISKDDNAIGELKLKGYAYPVFYAKQSGQNGARTYCILNSTLNTTKYNANKDTIVFPTEFTPDASPASN